MASLRAALPKFFSTLEPGSGKSCSLTRRAPDAGDSAVIPSSFLRLSLFLAGRLRRPCPSAGNANRWAASPSFYPRKIDSRVMIDNKTFQPIIIAVTILANILSGCSTTDTPILPTSTPLSTSTSISITASSEATITITPVPHTETPQPTPFFSFTIDRHDPESMIRAWFDALVRQDSIAMASVDGWRYSEKYGFTYPIESVRILKITLISDAVPNQRDYRVLFDVQIKKGQDGHDLPSGVYEWAFTVTWDANRDSWLVRYTGG